MKFKEFKHIRYNEPPYDLPTNQAGFARYQGSDISAHLPFLEFIARECQTITEFGTRDCYSTTAFLAGCKGVVHSYDIITTPAIELLETIQDKPCKWIFYRESSTDPTLKIEKTNLLFIDSLHTYGQVKTELNYHHTQVDKYILFHDTVSFPEINKAIEEFMDDVEPGRWKKVYDVKFNHGLLLIKRVY
jgi:hypothetical protein